MTANYSRRFSSHWVTWISSQLSDAVRVEFPFLLSAMIRNCNEVIQTTFTFISYDWRLLRAQPRKYSVMFGRMIATPILQVGTDADLQPAITSLSKAADQAEIVRWIEFPNSVLLFLVVPGDVLDRKTGTWYSLDFDDKQYGGYSVRQLEELLKDCHFLDLAERPGLWHAV